MAYDARTQNDLAKWWVTGTGSTVNRLSEVMDDMPDGPAIYHVDTDDDWTQNGATDEWYVATATKPDDVAENLAGWRNMTGVADDSETGDGAGLNADEWCYDTDNNRVYIRLSDDSDPNDTDVRKHYAWDGSGAGPAIMTETIEDLIYLIHLYPWIGDDTTSTTLTSINGEMVYVNCDLVIQQNATLTLGALSNNHGVDGASWIIELDTNQINFISGGVFNVYASSVYYKGANIPDFTGAGGSFNWKDSIIRSDDQVFRVLAGLDSGSIMGCFLSEVSIYCQISLTFSDTHSHEPPFYMIGGFGTWTITEPNVTNPGFAPYRMFDANTMTVIDPKVPITSVQIDNVGGAIKEVYTCNIHTADKDGTDLASALIDCEYAHLVEGSDGKTYKCIADHTAVDATHKPITGTDWADYWVLYDAGGGLGGDWDTGFDYKSGTAEFATQTTDANGDMTEQNIQYKKWIGTSEVLEARIHKFTLYKAGYETFPKEDKIVNGHIVWDERLLGATGPGIQKQWR